MDSRLTKENVESSGFDPKIGQVLELLCNEIGGKNVLLAGGAVRDLLMGGAIKDYDIYLRLDEHQNPFRVLTGTGSIPIEDLKITRLGSQKDYTSSAIAQQHLKSVWESRPNENKWGLHLQFLIVDVDPRSYVQNGFDFDICKSWYYPATNAFYFNKSRHPTILKPKNMGELAHAQRIEQKYPWFLIDESLLPPLIISAGTPF